jgi:hypothetical protein
LDSKEKQRRIDAYHKGDVRWFEDEFTNLYLGDERLKSRLVKIMESRMNNP